MCSSKNGVAAREIERKYGICARSAWFMLQRIREAMGNGGAPLDTMRGVIEADETYYGGDPKYRHAMPGPQAERVVPGSTPKGRPGMGKTDKQPVLSIINMGSGEVRSFVVPNVQTATLRKVIAEHVDMPGSVLHTDSGNWYSQEV
jgi:hypothetical protein